MKKNRTMRVATLLLALTLITSCFVGGTFAKYTSSANATSTATVAKWSIKVNGTEIAVTGNEPTVEINLFNTIYDTNGGAEEKDVAPGKIAPGTKGSFALAVTNESEVNAVYSLSFEIANTSNIPLQFSTDGQNWKDSIDEIAVENEAINMGQTSAATTTVYWQWPFERVTGETLADNDKADTELGIAAQTAAPTLTVTATITATQVD